MLYAENYDADNINLGPCWVYWKPTGGTMRHVGHTFGGTSVSITQSTFELKSDQYGDIPIKIIDAGLRIEVTVNLAEASFDNLTMLFTTATESSYGGEDMLTFGKAVAGAINTGVLILEPTDGTDVITVYKAAANIGEAIELTYTTDNQRVYACKFVGLIDDTRTEGDKLFRIGGFSSP